MLRLSPRSAELLPRCVLLWAGTLAAAWALTLAGCAAPADAPAEAQGPVATTPVYPDGPTADPERFAEAIAAFEARDAADPPAPGQVLFIGSSSIRGWKLGESFPELDALNRGFGGSHFSDVLYYFDRVVTPYQPRAVVVYEGDNDIAAGRSPRQVFRDYLAFVERARGTLGPDTPVVFVAIKPSPARWDHWPAMREANRLIEAYAAHHDQLFYADVATPMLAETPEGAPEGSPPPADLFLGDGLHLTPKGYALWAEVVGPFINQP